MMVSVCGEEGGREDSGWREHVGLKKGILMES